MPDLLNPYSVGGSLNESRSAGFCGREGTFDFVLRTLQTVQRPPIVLFGQRRIGKSSVLRQLSRRLPPGMVSVFFDLQGQAALPLDTLLYGLAREVATVCGVPRPERADITSETFLGFLENVCTKLGSPRNLVLTFDEFDVIDAGVNTNSAASTFLGFLASLIERLPDIGIIMVVGRKVSELSETFAGAILRNAVHHRLGRLSRELSDALASSLGQGTLDFTKESLTSLYGLAAGHPYCTQLLCNMIWQMKVTPDVALPVRVTADDVAQALAPALDYGTSGLSWIYDGLDAPSHRLFLAALAELQAEGTGTPVTMERIEQRLVKSGALFGAVELRTAPAKLANWDVVDPVDGAFRFAVPIIGHWIRDNRPLAELEAQARLANPRAWRFYELATLSRESEKFAEAIGLYQQALTENPAIIEAYLALAACYRARDAEGDLSRAIEAYQQACDRDANAPRSALLEALGEEIDRSPHLPDRQIQAFQRLSALAPESPTTAHARRHLQKLAEMRLPLRRELKYAEALFQALGDDDGLQRVAQRKKETAPVARFETVCMLLFFLGIGVSMSLGFVPVERWWGWPATALLWPRRLLLAIGIGAMLQFSDSKYSHAHWRSTLATAISCAGTIGCAYFSSNLIAGGIVGFFITAIAGGILMGTVDLPPELKPPRTAESSELSTDIRRPFAKLVLDISMKMQRFAQNLEDKKS